MIQLNGKWLAVALTALVIGLTTTAAQAQQNRGGPGGGGGGNGRGITDDRMKELLGASTDEWDILKPRIERVQQLQRANAPIRSGWSLLFGSSSSGNTNNGNNGGGRQGRRGAGGGGNNNTAGAAATSTEQSAGPVEDRAKELQRVVENKSSVDEYKSRLAALREARLRAKADLAASQEELRDLCTVRQEVLLVLLGILE